MREGEPALPQEKKEVLSHFMTVPGSTVSITSPERGEFRDSWRECNSIRSTLFWKITGRQKVGG